MTDEKQGNVYFQRSLATSRLIDALKTGKVGDVKTDAELALIAGGDVAPKGSHYGYLMSAINWCRDREGVFWKRVRSAGLVKCTTHDERVEAAEAQVKSSRRAAGRAIKIGRTVDTAALDSDTTKRYTATMAQAAMQTRAGEKRVRDSILAGQSPQEEMRRLAERVITATEDDA